VTGRRGKALAVVFAFPLAAAAQQPPIQDNSFLIEEAYNQEPGVVQHIATWSRARGGDWDFTFTQEWPLAGLRHQGSYTLPLVRVDGATGLGDVALNYRYQVGTPESGTLLAPRLTLLLPTGSETRGRGAGGAGLQVNLPLTHHAGSRLVTHWNAGATLVPSARDPAGRAATTLGLNLGASAVWLLRPELNLLLEAVWERAESAVGEGAVEGAGIFSLNPGVRWALDFPGALQVVPGLAYTVTPGPDPSPDAVFLYLSFEHTY
jgi:hypothetical protein